MPFYNILTSFVLEHGGTRRFHSRFGEVIRKRFGPEFESHYHFLPNTKIIYLSEFGYIRINAEYECIEYIIDDESKYMEYREMEDLNDKQNCDVYSYLRDHIPDSYNSCGFIYAAKTGMPLVRKTGSVFAITKSELCHDIINMIEITELVENESEGHSLFSMMNDYTVESGLDWIGSKFDSAVDIATRDIAIKTGDITIKTGDIAAKPSAIPYIPAWDSIARAILSVKIPGYTHDLSGVNHIIAIIASNSNDYNLAYDIARYRSESTVSMVYNYIISNSIIETINREGGKNYPLLKLRFVKMSCNSNEYILEINGNKWTLETRADNRILESTFAGADTYLGVPIVK